MVNTVSEHSRFRIIWDLFILILIFTSCALIPFQIAFQHEAFTPSTKIIYLIDLFFLVDIFLNSRTSYRHQGVEVTDRRKVATHYLKTFFLVDLLANLPLDILLLGSQDVQIYSVSLVLVLRIFRLLRIVRLYVIFRRWEIQNWINPGYLRIARFLATIVLLIHWIACTWFLIAFIDHFPEDCWAVRAGIVEADPTTQYIRSLYWTVTTTTTVGYGDITPSRPVEYVLTIVVMLLGASMYAFIIGNIASLFSNLDSAKASYWNRIEAAAQYLRYRRAPHELNARVMSYYEYLWAVHRGLSEGDFFDDLPRPLRLEVLLHLTRELLDKVPLFRYCSPSLRSVLLTSLKPQTYAPDGYVVREGEVGREIYFISRGQAEITSSKGEKYHGTLEDGDHFGDLSLILGERRTGSVKALTYCEMFILTSEDFSRIREEYPEFREVLKKVSSEKTEKTAALVLDGVIL